MIYNFPMTVDRRFKNMLEELHDKYGDKLMELEGMSPSQLDACNFMANFMESNTVADASIDDNANVGNKTVPTMLNESFKPFLKLLSRNKIFIEMAEEFGIEDAKTFLEWAVNGRLYEHDSHLSSFLPYSYFGDETVLVRYKGITHVISFKELYNLVDEPIELLHAEDQAYAKYTDDLTIWDKDKWTKVIRVIQKPRKTDFVFIKGSNGVSQIVTTNHPVITTEGEIDADKVTLNNHIVTSLPPVTFGNITHINIIYELHKKDIKEKDALLFNGEHITNEDNCFDGQVSMFHSQACLPNLLALDEKLGWLYGMILAEGGISQTGLNITQNDGDILNQVKKVLIDKMIPFSIHRKEGKCNRIEIRSKILMLVFKEVFGYTNGARNKKLPSDFLKYNKDFLKGIVGGLIDGDGTLMLKTNRRCILRIVSRELLNQVSFIVQLMGYNVRDGRPVSPGNNKGCAFKSNHHVYQIAFTPYSDGELFSSVKIANNVENYTTRKEGEKYCNARYSFGYGEKKVINADILHINDEFVYDISTETQTFMCNNIKSHNCFAFSLKNIVNKGLYFLTEMKAEPPKHWDTFNHHTLEFISYATNQLAGAVGVPDYLIYAYYFFQKDTKGMTPEAAAKYRDQKFQEIIFNLNQPYLKGSTQSAYTNFSILDRMHIVKFFGTEYYPDGSMITEHLFGILEFQKAFLDYAGKLRQVKWYTFPVISASLIFKEGVYEDEDTAKTVIEHNWKYGFNDVNIMNVEEATRLASCCRLVSNKEEINSTKDVKIFNSIGGSDVNVGSTKVVTLNLVRHALESYGIVSNFIEEVKKSLDIIYKYHYAQRNCIKKLISKGMLPLYSYDLMSLDDQFATIGINGVFEAIKILGGIDETSSGYRYNNEGYTIAKDLFSLINSFNSRTLNKYGYLSNVEQVPAESSALKLCKKDRLIFGNNVIDKELGEGYYIYGNQWIPLKENASLFARIDSAKLDRFCGGGAIQHINLGERFQTFEDAYEFAIGLASAGVGYYSIISIMDICKNDHTFFGDTCPICEGKSVDKGVKIVGYLVKSTSFKKERKRELSERKFYNDPYK